MKKKNYFEIVLSSSILIFISFILINNFQKTRSFQESKPFVINSNWETPSISYARLEGSGSISHETITESTDFSRKIVNFAPNTSIADKATFIESIGGEIIDDQGGNTVVQLPSDTLAQAEQTLNQNNEITSETDYAVTLLSTADWGVTKIRAPQIWESTRGSGVKIAIVDTGVDRTHPDLTNYVGGYDFVNEDADPQDDNGHGTSIAGIALAAQNGVNTIGVAPSASLLGVKVMTSTGAGFVSDVIEGIDWAVANGAQVINLSLGTTYDSTYLRAAVDRATNAGVIVVAAAGNTGGGNLVYPAAYDSVIAVGATDQNNALASFSSVGSELVAPGVSITTSALGGGTRTISGTSAASPHVAGLVANLIAVNAPNPRTALRDSATDIGQAGADPYFGFGLVDSVNAVAEAIPDIEAPQVSFASPQNGQTFEVTNPIDILVNASDNKEVIKVDLVVNNEFTFSSATQPYQWTWNPTASTSGSYRLVANAIDKAGNIATQAISITLTDTTSTPSASPISSPTPIPEENTQEEKQTESNAPDIKKTYTDNSQEENKEEDKNEDKEENSYSFFDYFRSNNRSRRRNKGVKGISTTVPSSQWFDLARAIYQILR